MARSLREPSSRPSDQAPTGLDLAGFDLSRMPSGSVLVPREPTEAMLNAARDWSATKYGKPIGNDAAEGCWGAMVSIMLGRRTTGYQPTSQGSARPTPPTSGSGVIPPKDRSAAQKPAWRDIGDAPLNEEVEVRVGRMTFLAKLVPSGAIDTNENVCDQWQATREGEHPPCWSDGCCWTVNEDENCSMWPEAWRPAQGIEVRQDRDEGSACESPVGLQSDASAPDLLSLLKTAETDLSAALARVERLEKALNFYRSAAVTSATMEGLHYRGVSSSMFRHAWEADRAALSEPNTPDVAKEA